MVQNTFWTGPKDFGLDKNDATEMTASQYKMTTSKLISRDAVRFSNPGGHYLTLLVGIGLTELPNSVWAKAHPANPLAASLHMYVIEH